MFRCDFIELYFRFLNKWGGFCAKANGGEKNIIKNRYVS